MSGYVANIVLPRFGEVWRCILVARYEKLSFEKVFGTVVAERIADTLVLLIIMSAVIIIQLAELKEALLELFEGFLETNSLNQIALKAGVAAIIAIVGFIIGWRMIRYSDNRIASKIRGLAQGLLEGILSITTMKDKWAFLAHTVFIWAMYLIMFYVPFLALPETSEVSLGAVLSSFVIGTFSIVLVQGGIGVYPVAIAQTLALYSIDYESGFAMGWIIWVAQTSMTVFWGVLSLLLMPVFNSRINTQSA